MTILCFCFVSGVVLNVVLVAHDLSGRVCVSLKHLIDKGVATHSKDICVHPLLDEHLVRKPPS